MPELPDVQLYIHALESRVVGETLEKVRLASPFLLRSVDPPIHHAENRKILGLRRLGKRIVFELEDDHFLVFHLMIAGRFRWRPAGSSHSRASSASPHSIFPPARWCSPRPLP